MKLCYSLMTVRGEMMIQRNIFITLCIVCLTGCSGVAVQPAYQAAVPSCGMGSVQVCDNFGHARNPRTCACVNDTLLLLD